MLDTSKVDPYVLKILEEHGWYKERVYDSTNYLNILASEGYDCFDYAEAILQSLGGIFINVAGDKTHMSATFHFDPVRAASGEFDKIHKYEIAANEKLYPIGEMVQAIAYVGRSKKIYWGDDYLYWIGDSIEDYLNNLFDLNFESVQISNDN